MTDLSNKCVIDSIINQKIPAYIIAENDLYIAFLDHRPVFPGHTLVAPKQHVETLYDLQQELVQGCFTFVQKIGKAVEAGMQAEGTFVAMNNIVSQSIPHLHIHIIPRTKGDGLKGFFWPRVVYANAEHMLQTQQRIVQCLT